MGLGIILRNGRFAFTVKSLPWSALNPIVDKYVVPNANALVQNWPKIKKKPQNPKTPKPQNPIRVGVWFNCELIVSQSEFGFRGCLSQ